MMQRSTIRLCSAAVAAAGADPLVLVSDTNDLRTITINRPKALNALSFELIQELHKEIVEKKDEDRKKLCIIEGGPKSFSTGGDVIQQTTGNTCKNLGYWSCVQGQNDFHVLTATTTTYISIQHGYVMGGAAGLALSPRYRIATEATQFAMPECSIGFFPNGGTTWTLPRVAVNGLGLYLALTGARLKAADMVHAGLATHYIPSASLPALKQQLSELSDPFHASSCIQAFQPKEVPPFSLEKEAAVLEKVFGLRESTTVEGIIEALNAEAESSDLAKSALKTLSTCSPTSLKLVVEQHKRSLKMSSQLDALTNEVYAAQRMGEEHDFNEGVRALLRDKTKDPKWSPATLAEVTPSLINSFFGKSKEGFYVFDPTNPVKPLS